MIRMAPDVKSDASSNLKFRALDTNEWEKVAFAILSPFFASVSLVRTRNAFKSNDIQVKDRTYPLIQNASNV